MNKFIGIGRLTDEPAIIEKGDSKIVKYSLAIDRIKEGTDYPSCVAFGKQAEFAEKYFHKGIKVAITGRVQTGSYINRNGDKVYTTDIIVEAQEFCERKPEEPERSQPQFFKVPDNFKNPFEED